MWKALLDRMFHSDRRLQERLRLPGLSAHYWTGHAGGGRDVLNISSSGSYLLTEERWYPGTVIRMVLQSNIPQQGDSKANGGDCGNSMYVHARIIRSGPEGVGIKFLFHGDKRERPILLDGYALAEKKKLIRFLDRIKQERGELYFTIE